MRKLFLLLVMVSVTMFAAAEQKAEQNIMITAKLEVQPAYADSIISWAQELLLKTPHEEGCISYNLYRDINRPNTLIFVEVYRDQAAVDFHLTQPYLDKFRKLRDPHLLSKPQVLIFPFTLSAD